jgi:hypothetical protein
MCFLLLMHINNVRQQARKIKYWSELVASNPLHPADGHGSRDQPRTGMVKFFRPREIISNQNFCGKMSHMETMTLTIQVPQNIGAILEKKAKNQGKDVAEYVETLIEKDIDERKTLDEILAPIRKNFADSGMSEDDLDKLIESERQAMWEEKNVR